MEKNKLQKTVLITGASSGIGEATAQLLSKQGYQVFGTSRKPKSSTNKWIMIALDLNQPDSITRAIQEVIRQAGKIDVLINNAGLGITGPAEETPLKEVENVFQANLFGTCQVINEVIPHMRKNKFGKIINITSIAGYMGLPYRGFYSASKAALIQVSEAYRMEIEQFGIQVSCLAPGDIATNIASRRFHSVAKEKSPYFENYQASLNLMDNHLDEGMSALKVALEIEKIIKSRKPKVHYLVGGFLEKFSIYLKRFLPQKTYESLLKKHYNL